MSAHQGRMEPKDRGGHVDPQDRLGLAALLGLRGFPVRTQR
jgi:hypothetical protein